MALCLPVSEWQNYCIRNQIFKFWSLLLHKAVVFDSTVPLLADLHQWFLILQYLCKHLYLLISISSFWFFSTCTMQASLLAGPVICISGFWFYRTGASTSACRYASVVSGSTVLVQTLLLDDQHQWFLVLQYLCKRLYLLICISGFWLYSTCTDTFAWWSASVVSGSTIPVQAPLLADLHQWFLTLQYLYRHFCLMISISGFWFYNTCASTSTCWSASVVSDSTVFVQVHLRQYLCRHFYLLMSMISGVWFCSTCANASACWSASVVSGSTIPVQTPLPARQHQWFLVLQCLCRCLCLLISFSGLWLDYSTCADTFACWWAAVVSGSAVLVQVPLLVGSWHKVISISGFTLYSTSASASACGISISGFWQYSTRASASAYGISILLSNKVLSCLN